MNTYLPWIIVAAFAVVAIGAFIDAWLNRGFKTKFEALAQMGIGEAEALGKDVVSEAEKIAVKDFKKIIGSDPVAAIETKIKNLQVEIAQAIQDRTQSLSNAQATLIENQAAIDKLKGFQATVANALPAPAPISTGAPGADPNAAAMAGPAPTT